MKKLSSISLLGSCVAVTALTFGSMVNFSYASHAAEGKACYEQFSEAKKSGKLTEKNFKEYKDVHCAEKVESKKEAIPAQDHKTEAKPSMVSPESAKETAKTVVAEKAKQEEAEKKAILLENVVFPDRVDPKFANEKEGSARMHTCQEQYNTNKTSGKNGELKWIQKGGGYYSECNKHLKDAAQH